MQTRSLILLSTIFAVILGTNALATSPATRSTTQPTPFVCVFIDEPSEDRLGPFPYDRSVYAPAIRSLDRSGARAIIVKFFLDQSKSREGDNDLANALKACRARIILQACMHDDEQAPNEWPTRYDAKVRGTPLGLLSGQSGWIPLPKFCDSAFDVGFADVRDTSTLPTMLEYKGHHVKSLFTSALEAAFDDVAVIDPGKSITIGEHSLPLNARSEIEGAYPKQAEMDDVFSFVDVLKGHIDPSQFQDRVVILGYDGYKAPTIATSDGPIGVHPCFDIVLNAAYRRLLDSARH